MRLKTAGSHLLTKSHDLHRRRRKPLEPFFSRLGVSRLQHMLSEVVEKLASRIEALKGTNSIIRLDHAFSAFSGDIIGRICWEGEKEFLDDPEFAPEWYATVYLRCPIRLTDPRYNVIHMIIRSVPLFTMFPFIIQ